MAKKPTIVADKPPPDVTVTFSRVEALALVVAAEHGLKVIEAFNLVRSTGAMEEAIRKLRAAT